MTNLRRATHQPLAKSPVLADVLTITRPQGRHRRSPAQRALVVRSIVRGTASGLLILFVWYSLSRVEDGAAEGPALAGISALLLLGLLVVVSRRGRK